MSVGVHLLADFYGCSFDKLNDKDFLLKSFVAAAEAADCHVLSTRVHEFQPQGVTLVVIVSESHLSYHGYPELGYAAIDIFTCGPSAMPEKALALLETLLEPKDKNIQKIARGTQLDET